MRLTLLLLAVYLESLAMTSGSVNPACECVIFDGRDKVYGTFTSPNFPQVYPGNINCILYTFIGHSHQIVELNFIAFDLPLPLTTNCAHFVRLFLDLDRPEVNEHNRWNYELCGNLSVIQSRYYSSTSSLTMEFHTDHLQSNYTGFKGTYRLLDKVLFDVSGGTPRWGTQCSFDFYSNKNAKMGSFFSPKYPQNYPPDSNCLYFFYGKPHETVSIIFHSIQLEPIDGSCSNSLDYIVVRNGLDSLSPVIGRFCNDLTQIRVTSTSENLCVEFVSDSKKQLQGFSASFSFRNTNPDPSFHDEATLFPSRSTAFPLGRDDPNDFDAIDPGDSPAMLTKPAASEYEHYYKSTESKYGTFTSHAQYPDPYRNDVTVRHTFIAEKHERVQIAFTDLELNRVQEDSHSSECDGFDVVTVSVFDNQRPRDIGVFCGTKRPPMLMSNADRMDVTFASRNSGKTAKGFSANFSFVTDFGIKSGRQDPPNSCKFIYESKKSTNGTFTSPNFPGLYPCNTECHYLFHGEEGERIHITFPYFDVEGIPPQCLDSTQSDYVELSNFNIHLIDRKMNRLCGTKEQHVRIGPEIRSDGNFFRVTFKSNSAFDATGFEAFYQFRRSEELSEPDKRAHVYQRSTSNRVSSNDPNTVFISFVVLSFILLPTFSSIYTGPSFRLTVRLLVNMVDSSLLI